MINTTKQGELFYLYRLMAYFKTPKKVLMDDCQYQDFEKGNIRILEFPTLNHLFGYNQKTYVCQDQKADMNIILNYDKFVKSKVYEQFLMGEGCVRNPNQYVMALVLKKFIWMIYRTNVKESYWGLGGITLASGGEGLIITPIDNYLKDYFGNLPDNVEYPLPP